MARGALCGSHPSRRATGRAHPNSDLDIAVLPEPGEEYLTRVDAQLATERLLERMIGRMLDINYHIAIEQAGVAPRDFFESFLKMGELGVLPPDFAREIARAAGRALRDIPIYLSHIHRFLETMAKNEAGRGSLSQF